MEEKGSFNEVQIDYEAKQKCEYGTLYRLKGNTYIYISEYNIQETIFTSEWNTRTYYYLYNSSTKSWAKFFPENRKRIPTQMPQMMKDFIIGTADVVIPLESGATLITGKNFSGEESSRLVAAGLVVWDLSGGKIIKGAKIIGKVGSTAVEGMVKAFGKKAVKEGTEVVIEKVGKYDWGLVKRYFKHIQEVTGREVHQKQIDKLKEALRKKEYKKLSSKEVGKHRAKFTTSVKNNCIKQWEQETGQIWPKYTEIIYDKNGDIYKKIGDPYDAHHIIENQFEGPHEWWNIHPAKFPNEHQKLIHGKDSPSKELFK